METGDCLQVSAKWVHYACGRKGSLACSSVLSLCCCLVRSKMDMAGRMCENRGTVSGVCEVGGSAPVLYVWKRNFCRILFRLFLLFILECRKSGIRVWGIVEVAARALDRWKGDFCRSLFCSVLPFPLFEFAIFLLVLFWVEQ